MHGGEWQGGGEGLALRRPGRRLRSAASSLSFGCDYHAAQLDMSAVFRSAVPPTGLSARQGARCRQPARAAACAALGGVRLLLCFLLLRAMWPPAAPALPEPPPDRTPPEAHLGLAVPAWLAAPRDAAVHDVVRHQEVGLRSRGRGHEALIGRFAAAEAGQACRGGLADIKKMHNAAAGAAACAVRLQTSRRRSPSVPALLGTHISPGTITC